MHSIAALDCLEDGSVLFVLGRSTNESEPPILVATSFDGFYDFLDALSIEKATAVSRVLATNYLIVAGQESLKVLLFKEKQFNEITNIVVKVSLKSVFVDETYIFCSTADQFSVVAVQMSPNLLKLI